MSFMSDKVLRAWLSEELKQRKWSQGELARQAGISRSFVSRVLSGDASPSNNFCYKVAHALGEAPEKVLRLAGILPLASEDEQTAQEIAEIIRNLGPDRQRQLLDYARYLLRLGRE